MSRPADAGGLHRIFGAELLGRLRWFVLARWAVAGAVLLFAGVAPALSMPVGWHQTWVVAALILAYNAAFHLLLFRRTVGADSESMAWLTRCAFLQIAFDLGAALLFVWQTGGAGSPFTVFLVFHMAIGTLLLSARIMLGVAAVVWSTCAALFLSQPAGAGVAAFALTREERTASLTALAAALFFMVYLTDTVAARFKERGVQLFHLANELEAKTAALEKLLDELRDIEARKSKFMLLSAHQLRSPLGTVRTSLDVLRQGYVECGSERGRRLLSGAVERVDGLLAIVSDLLELAKLREGHKRAPWATNVNIKQLLTDILDAMTPFAEERGIHIAATMADGAVLARGVPPDLVYAFENLIHNAVKYSFPDGEVGVELGLADGQAIIRVSDQGIGVPEEIGEDVFLEFVRAPNAKAHTPEGTGLGLAIVREVVTRHGGRVTLVPRGGGGSVFEVTLPLSMPPSVTTT